MTIIVSTTFAFAQHLLILRRVYPHWFSYTFEKFIIQIVFVVSTHISGEWNYILKLVVLSNSILSVELEIKVFFLVLLF